MPSTKPASPMTTEMYAQAVDLVKSYDFAEASLL